MRWLSRLLAATCLLALLPGGAALAACAATIAAKDGTGAAITVCDTTDGGTGLVPSIGVLGGANNANKLSVTANSAALAEGVGAAGAAAGGVLTIQGVAAMTKLLVTPDSVALPANQSVNVAQINGVTPLMGTGNTGTGSPRVTIATDQAAVPVTIAANGCAGQTEANTTTTPISLTANTRIITGVAAQKVRICAINLVVAAATNVALVEGTGSTCGTGTAGMAGGATAATGWNLAANGGMTYGNGIGSVLKVATAADDVCLLVSAANQVSGSVTWVSF